MSVGPSDFSAKIGKNSGRCSFLIPFQAVLVCHPDSTTQSGFAREEFETTGMSDGLVRISVGMDDRRDLLGNFEQVLAAGYEQKHYRRLS
jgi:hypothetical protein